jgi:RNA polymerase sigma factor, sigma-70 family
MEDRDSISFKMIEHLHKVQRKTLEDFAFSYVHDKAIAQDMVSEAFIALITNRSQVAPEKYLDYLHATVRYRSISYRRKDTGHKEVHDNIARKEKNMMEHWTRTIENNTFSVVQTQEIMRIYRQVLSNASPLSRTIFEMSRRDDKSRKEIAAELGISENKVKYETQKLLNELRSALSDYGDLFSLIVLVLTGLHAG